MMPLYIMQFPVPRMPIFEWFRISEPFPDLLQARVVILPCCQVGIEVGVVPPFCATYPFGITPITASIEIDDDGVVILFKHDV